MKFVSVIAAGLIVGTLVPAAAHAQLAEALVKRMAAAEPQRGRPDDAGRPFPREMELIQQGRGAGRGAPERERERDREPPPQAQAVRLVPLNAVVDAIARSVPGRLLDASPPSGGPRPVYRIRWQANSGQRIDFVVDAQTGAIIGRNGG
jgi:hypothetical protein